MTFRPDLAPLGGSLALSSVVAMLPLLTIFVTLGALRWKAHVAGLTALAVAVLVAVLACHMPVSLALLSATQGAVYGLFPIVWIVFTAIVLYQVTVASGRFEDLRAVFNLISDDPRVQAMLIAFCFGGLLEALAGFGAPVAITGVMLMAVGFSALRAATVVLLANTAPVAFGAIAIPIITAGNLTKIPYTEIGAYVGHQTPLLAAFVPLFLCLLADGRRGVRQLWPVALVTGLSFAVAQWVSATWLSVELTDIIASLVGLGAAVLMLRVWRPVGGAEALADLHADRDAERASLSEEARAALPADKAVASHLPSGRIWMALFPYLLVVVVFSLSKLWTPLKTWLAGTDVKIRWPGLDGHVLTAAGKPSTSTVYTFQWLSSPGTMLLICMVIVALVYRVAPRDVLREITGTAHKLRYSMLTIASVLSLAYVMNQSGQTITIGTWIAGTGAAFAFLSPVLGWLGTAVTGSDTSANALFATLQQTAGKHAGIDPTLLVAANTSGGVVGKMVSPQNLTIAATAVGLLGRESEILRRVIWWSLGLLVVLCLLVGLQSTPVLAWMLP
ncbi:L-lactate permease [Arsenicicoccus sp. oral taxon 190]|uniref:L-lactate permease n=1 Tax=Arsenicicoccus sp. oral taxon 190 TaxID=1658671 RepID=UPI00067A0DB2|nr:L-lactate permease [Arsenicicoccus sp. oral taxon 190]AKT51546.1 lactate permease [Arsenicicoccus sp. oral taxon 190]